jgi:hypothetical protein
MSEKSVDAVKAGHGPRLLVETDRVSYGVTRVFKDVKEPDETLPDQPRDFVEREYEVGDEALVEAGEAEWVVAPVHSEEAGRRLDSTPGAAEEFREGFDENGAVKPSKQAAPAAPAPKSGASMTGSDPKGK